MNPFLKICVHAFRSSCWLAAALILAGCGTLSSGSGGSAPDETTLTGNQAAPTNHVPATLGSSDVLRRGDPLTIMFSGVPDPPPRHEERIKEDGKINLSLIGAVEAAGRTIGELQDEILARYVPKYYKRLNVTVTSEARFFHVRGEVKNPNRHQYFGEMTVLKAIAAAGDFTDYANRKKVQLTRSNGQRFVINCVKALNNTKLDLKVYPDDQIFVPRRLW